MDYHHVLTFLGTKDTQHWPVQLVLWMDSQADTPVALSAQASQAFSQSGRYMTLVTWAMKAPEKRRAQNLLPAKGSKLRAKRTAQHSSYSKMLNHNIS